MPGYSDYSKNKNKIAILYILNAFSKEMDADQIWRCITEYNIMNYLDYNNCLLELSDKNMILKNETYDNIYYTISKKGLAALNEFKIELGKSVRNNLDNFIADNKKQFMSETDFTSNIILNNNGIYTVSLKMLFEHKSFFEINMNFNSKEEAVKSTQKWAESGRDIYTFVFNTLHNK